MTKQINDQTQPTLVDIDSWSRKEHFQFFESFDDPTFSLTIELDVTGLATHAEVTGDSLFLCYLHATMSAVNTTDAMKLRILNNEVVRYSTIDGNTTYLNEHQQFGFCELNFNPDAALFMSEASRAMSQAKALKENMLAVKQRQDVIHFSSLPWVNFTQFKHPYHSQSDHSIPKIMFGKIITKGVQKFMPMGITVHHGLVDGIHIGQFLDQLQGNLNQYKR